MKMYNFISTFDELSKLYEEQELKKKQVTHEADVEENFAATALTAAAGAAGSAVGKKIGNKLSEGADEADEAEDVDESVLGTALATAGATCVGAAAGQMIANKLTEDDDVEELNEKAALNEKTYKAVRKTVGTSAASKVANTTSDVAKKVDKKVAAKAIADKVTATANKEEKAKIMKQVASNVPPDKVAALAKELKGIIPDKGLTDEDKKLLKQKIKVNPKIIDGADTVLSVIDGVLDAVQMGLPVIGIIIDIIQLVVPEEAAGAACPPVGIAALILNFVPDGLIITSLIDLGITAIRGIGNLVKDGVVKVAGALPNKNTVAEGYALADEADKELKQLILECDKCGALIIKDEPDVVVDEATDLVNVEDTCQFCEETAGYTIIGVVAPYETTEGAAEDSEDLEELFDVSVDASGIASGNTISL